jgi:hypothetical protein
MRAMDLTALAARADDMAVQVVRDELVECMIYVGACPSCPGEPRGAVHVADERRRPRG